MTRLQRLFSDQGQSPWLDGLERSSLSSGQLQRMVAEGIRGLATNMAGSAHALARSTAYDAHIASLLGRALGAEDIYWELLVQDVSEALAALRPIYDRCGGEDGLVSVKISPTLAQDKEGTVITARSLQQQIAEPNLSINIPATDAGVLALREMTSEGRNVTVTAIFSLRRYQQVVEAYLSGLETCPGDLSGVHSVALFSLSQVDTAVDRWLFARRGPGVPQLQGKAAVAQARLAYRAFWDRFSGPRWETLAARGANPQRLAWASTRTPGPTQPGTFYLESLIGPGTVTTMDPATAAAFGQHGTVAQTLDLDIEGAANVLASLEDAGIDMGRVGSELEGQHVAYVARTYNAAIAAVRTKVAQLST